MSRFKRVNTIERRSAQRIPATEMIPHAITRLASGQEVELINIGLNGSILINSRKMLAPGSSVRLRMTFPGVKINIEGQVLRCRVVGLKQAKIQYEAAIVFDDGLPPMLAERLHASDAQDSQSTPDSAQEPNPDMMILPATAELWVLGAQEA